MLGEEVQRLFDGLGVDGIAIAAIRIDAGVAEDDTSHEGATADEYEVARMLKQFQRRMRDRLGISFGGGGRHDLVGASGNDRNRDRDIFEALRGKDMSGSRRHGEDGADARIAIGVAGLAIALPEIGIGAQPHQGLAAHLGLRRPWFAGCVGRRRATELLE